MKLLLQHTPTGLVPMYDSDYEEKKKLKIGEKYWVTIKKARNIKFHKKYFALIKCVWENMPENLQDQFGIQENFRYWLQMKAGYVERYIAPNGTELFRSKSVAFDKMDGAEFEDLYSKVIDVILKEIWPDMDQRHLEDAIIDFM